MKKKKGNITDFIAPLMGVIVIFVILVVGINYMASTKNYIKAQQISRKYLLKMECDGYLTPENILKMKNELKNENFENISINGTTLSKAKFGDDINLKIEYDQNFKQIEINGFNFKEVEQLQRVNITRSSTSKN